MRDQAYWERWIRDRPKSLGEPRASVKDWYREAGVEKGERRAFKAALKALNPDGVKGKRGKKPPRRGKGRIEGGGAPRGAPRDRRGADGGRAVEGRLRFTREGRPIVIPADPDTPIVRIPGHSLAGAWPKDRVLVRLERRRAGGLPYGRVERILERGIRAFVGRYAPTGNRSFVRFRDRESDLLLEVDLPAQFPGEPGDLVLAEVTEYPKGERDGRARVVRSLGKSHTMETLFLAVTSAMDLPVAFPGPVMEAAAAVPQAVRLSARGGGVCHGDEACPRVDQRDLPFVTIDGKDARDFDDAVCIVREGDGFRLLVAIADVSHYVEPGSPLDREAYLRGTSVYFPDRCIPMLPPELSEGVCSLKAGVNRLTMTVEIPIRPGGRPGTPSFHSSVIRSRARLTYDEVHSFLGAGSPAGGEGKAAGARITPEIGRMLRDMAAAAGGLTLARFGRGALDLDLPEAEIAVAEGMPVSVVPSERFESHRLIEEFMLLANTAVAEYLSGRGDAFLYRIHEEPAAEKIEEFEVAAARLLRRSRPPGRRDTSSLLQAWADLARGGKFERAVHRMLLRSLMLARYGPETKGHFGLALSRYTHFTSPIRRYPDLLVHRVLKAALGDRRSADSLRTLREKGPEIGSHLSDRERLATEAERTLEQRAKALFMAGQVGRVFEGNVSSLVSSGFFVELEGWMIDGMVHVSTLRDDEYRFSPDRMEWVGQYRKRRIGLGDRVRVRVRRADPDRGEVDFLLVEKMPESP
ncbi:MAG TPA: VacB/RNase II family 3'-5' exoribonuclease [Candidatus Deferrimicrobium sp.]|nr:VacB/RNase II family 3'-5' exoribonuclease [Candidatus Deferrimicrobium sp.]